MGRAHAPARPSWSGTETAQPSAKAAAIEELELRERPGASERRRAARKTGNSAEVTASIAHWYDTTGQTRSGPRSVSAITVVTVASG